MKLDKNNILIVGSLVLAIGFIFSSRIQMNNHSVISIVLMSLSLICILTNKRNNKISETCLLVAIYLFFTLLAKYLNVKDGFSTPTTPTTTSTPVKKYVPPPKNESNKYTLIKLNKECFHTSSYYANLINQQHWYNNKDLAEKLLNINKDVFVNEVELKNFIGSSPILAIFNSTKIDKQYNKATGNYYYYDNLYLNSNNIEVDTYESAKEKWGEKDPNTYIYEDIIKKSNNFAQDIIILQGDIDKQLAFGVKRTVLQKCEDIEHFPIYLNNPAPNLGLPVISFLQLFGIIFGIVAFIILAILFLFLYKNNEKFQNFVHFIFKKKRILLLHQKTPEQDNDSKKRRRKTSNTIEAKEKSKTGRYRTSRIYKKKIR